MKLDLTGLYILWGVSLFCIAAFCIAVAGRVGYDIGHDAGFKRAMSQVAAEAIPRLKHEGRLYL